MSALEARRSVALSVACGAVFGLGLVISGMSNPAKVLAFLDVAGAWDPSLAFVMAGAIGVHAPLLRLVLRRSAPLAGPAFVVPRLRAIDGRLLAGAAVFGVGWGLGGYCPGPGILSAGAGATTPVLFTVAMAVGVLVHRRLFERPRAAEEAAAGDLASEGDG